jgi:3-oxoadipate enol-lactonase
MPRAMVNGTELYYEDTGPGSTGKTLVFSHGLLMSRQMFDAQVAHFRDRYRCIGYDHRGQGLSADVAGRSIDVETTYADAVKLMEKLELGPVHFCGLSMGGFVALRLALRRPELVRSIVLIGTSAETEPEENLPRYRRLNFVARWIGPAIVAPRVMPILFGKTLLNDPTRAAEREFWLKQLKAIRRSIYRAVNGVMERGGVLEQLGNISVPTLIMVGDEDLGIVPAKSEHMRNRIDGARLVVVPEAGHSPTIEQPERVNAAMDEFLDQAAN